MVSENAKTFLRSVYGDRYFDWDISDYQLDRILDDNEGITYEALNNECTELERLMKEAKELMRLMFGR